MRPALALLAMSPLAMSLLAALVMAASAQADDVDALVARLPRAFIGEFRWDDGVSAQNVAIRFKTVRRLDLAHAEALGCGIYDVAGRVTAIDVRMVVTVVGLQVEIWESRPDTTAFVTDGSHRGRLTSDLHAIEAEWTTAGGGEHGHLRLEAAPVAHCAPTSTS
jgi:hypothetical protein